MPANSKPRRQNKKPTTNKRTAPPKDNKVVPGKPARAGEPANTRSEIQSKIARVRRQLEEMRDYKRILAEDGLKPDEQDKFKESGLIKNLLSLEKKLDISKPTKTRSKGFAGKKRPPQKNEAKPRVKSRAKPNAKKTRPSRKKPGA